MKKLTMRVALNKLPHPYNLMAIKNTTKKVLSEKVTASNPIIGAFLWSETKEGFDFWYGIEDNWKHEKP